MDIIAGLIILIGVVLFIKIMTGKKPKKKIIKFEKLPLRDLVKRTFPKYHILQRHETIMICEINHRNEPDELVFIRIKPNEAKNIRKSGRMLICNYPRNPTAQEMLSDFRGHL